jgi:hypothetical protein
MMTRKGLGRNSCSSIWSNIQRIYPEEGRGKMRKLQDSRKEIWTRDIMNTKHDAYCWTSTFEKAVIIFAMEFLFQYETLCNCSVFLSCFHWTTSPQQVPVSYEIAATLHSWFSPGCLVTLSWCPGPCPAPPIPYSLGSSPVQTFCM